MATRRSTGRSTQLRVSAPELAAVLREPREGELDPVFSPLADERYGLGLETIYEGYLVHYGRPRLLDPADDDTALVLGDHLYAQGLARIASLGEVAAVADLAELISLCAQARADRRDGDGAAWAATAAALGRGGLEEPRAELRDNRDADRLEQLARRLAGDHAVDEALAAHARLLG